MFASFVEAGGTPGPIHDGGGEASGYRVGVYVVQFFEEFFVGFHIVVVEPGLPDRAGFGTASVIFGPFLPIEVVDFVGTYSFPDLQKSSYSFSRLNGKNGVKVIGHDDESVAVGVMPPEANL
jgi:hypothetical protein